MKSRQRLNNARKRPFEKSLQLTELMTFNVIQGQCSSAYVPRTTLLNPAAFCRRIVKLLIPQPTLMMASAAAVW